jgi:acetylornithine deacetylase/succinyl-diaminopimelate desuccinylase-like protein
MHAADENVSLADLETLTSIYHLVLRDFLGAPC